MSLKKYFVPDTGDGNYDELKTKKIIGTLYKGVRIPWVRIVIGAFLSVFNVLVLLTQYENYMAMYQGTLTDLSPLWWYLAAIFIQYVLIFLCVISDRALVEVVTEVGKKLWRKLMRMPVRDFETSEPGGMLSRITLDAQYASRPFEAVVAGLQGIVTVITLSVVVPSNVGFAAPWLVLALICAVALAFCTARVLSRSTLYAQNRKAGQTEYYSEVLSNVRFIKASGAEQKVVSRSVELIEKRYGAALYTAFYQGLVQLVGNYINLVLAVCFAAAIPAILSGAITDIEPINGVYAFLFAIGAVVQGFMIFPTYFSEAVGGTRKIVSVLRRPEEDVSKGAELDDASGDIRMEHVSFAYTDRDALRDVNVTIPAGKITAIVGMNGSGKSTLIKLIDRLYPAKGGGLYLGERRAEELSLKSWRRAFAVVSQKNVLFSGTLRDNLCYGVEDPSEEDIQRAVEAAGLSGFAAENGLDYDVGVAGSRLSGGEAQRVSVARALLKDPRYLILDEATANLDTKTGEAVRDGVAELMRGRTTIVIAHDYAAIEHADYVVVMRDGTVEDHGEQAEMIARSPFMKLMVEG